MTVRVGCQLAPTTPTIHHKKGHHVHVAVSRHGHQDEVDLKDHQSAQKERRASSVSPEQDLRVPKEAFAQAAEDEQHNTHFTRPIVFVTLPYPRLLISSAQSVPPRVTSRIPSIVKLPSTSPVPCHRNLDQRLEDESTQLRPTQLAAVNLHSR